MLLQGKTTYIYNQCKRFHIPQTHNQKASINGPKIRKEKAAESENTLFQDSLSAAFSLSAGDHKESPNTEII